MADYGAVGVEHLLSSDFGELDLYFVAPGDGSFEAIEIELSSSLGGLDVDIPLAITGAVELGLATPLLIVLPWQGPGSGQIIYVGGGVSIY